MWLLLLVAALFADPSQVDAVPFPESDLPDALEQDLIHFSEPLPSAPAAPEARSDEGLDLPAPMPEFRQPLPRVDST